MIHFLITLDVHFTTSLKLSLFIQLLEKIFMLEMFQKKERRKQKMFVIHQYAYIYRAASCRLCLYLEFNYYFVFQYFNYANGSDCNKSLTACIYAPLRWLESQSRFKDAPTLRDLFLLAFSSTRVCDRDQNVEV